MDKESLERTRRAKNEYQKGEYIIVKNSSEIEKLSR